jgi:glycosyltransferase involved in cell wall biosynthesis
MADTVGRFWPDAVRRTRVVPLAADAAFVPSSDADAVRQRAAALIGTAGPYFLVVGQNSPTKRHADAVRAFAAAAPQSWRLVLVERHTSGRSLITLASRLGTAPAMTVLPTVTHTDLITLLQGAGALVQPSSYEGFGLPVLEAMACGCPVIASDIPTLREVLGGAGLLTPPRDVGRLAGAMRSISASAELRADLRGRGFERAALFSWDRCARETLSVYLEAAGNSGGA